MATLRRDGERGGAREGPFFAVAVRVKRLEPARRVSNAENVSRRSRNATVVSSALALCACAVYGPGDLIGNDTAFGDGGFGGAEHGGSSGAGVSGGAAARGGTGTGGFVMAGAGGSGGEDTGDPGGAGHTGGTGGSAGSTAKATGGSSGNASGGTAATAGGGAEPTSGAGGSTGGKGTTGGANSGGSVASGGAGGSVVSSGGGSPGTGGEATGGTAPLPPELIDDMEDGNQAILLNDDRTGAWYTAVGAGGEAEPAPMKSFSMTEIVGTPGAAGSTQAMHFKGSGGTEWGAMAAFDFSVKKAPYDATAYKGITFWVKAAAAANIVVRIPIKDTSLEAMGACMAMTNGCENHFSAPVALTTSWKQVSLPWASFKQDATWGFQTTFARTQLISVQFVVLSAIPPATPPSADFLIDDVAFIP